MSFKDDSLAELASILAIAVTRDLRAKKKAQESAASRLSSPEEPCSVSTRVNGSESPTNGRTR